MKNIVSIFILLGGLFSIISCKNTSDKKQNAQKPNVVIIYSDDIGYGDIGVYGATQIPTPNIDQLAREGIRFTDGHCAASTCSPSRYALLTGEMGFRKNVGVQPVNAPLSIDVDQYTIGNLFKDAGYETALIGKWHLGLGEGDLDWNKEIKPGPNELGFDYSFIIPSTNDRSPFVYVENHHVYNLDPNDPITVSRTPIPDSVVGTKYPDAILNPEAITVYPGDLGHCCSVINGVGRIGYMKGGKSALWNDNDIADNLVDKAKGFITKNADEPFFLLLTTSDIHAPRLPHPRFKGTTELSYRGDNVVQLDWSVGEIVKLLKERGLEENTLVIFSSDNGPVYIDGGYQDGSNLGNHKAAGIYRGGKYTIYEGGTRVPFIIKWPAKIEPQVSSALISQVDFLASFGAFFNTEIPHLNTLDSRNYWDTFLGIDSVGADIIIEQTNTDDGLALRNGNIKFVRFKNGREELYDLSVDPGEKNNIVDLQPELVEAMRKELLNLNKTSLNSYFND